MKSVDYLKSQHREFDEAFRRIERAQPDQHRDYFVQVASKLVAHEAIEERLFYPACRKAFGDDPILQEAYAQHGVVSYCLAQAEHALGLPYYLATVRALVEAVEHHVAEEEREIFPKFSSWFKKNPGYDDEKLALEMSRLYEFVAAADYRVPLYETLNRSLGAAQVAKSPPLVARPPPLIATAGNGSGVPRANMGATPKA